MSDDRSRQPFRILAVCTGNICRSPMVERLLQAGLDERFPGEFIVGSAGTAALVGNPIDPPVAEFIRVLGGNDTAFSARQLTTALLQQQDLVLALTRDHRSKVVEMSPAMLRRTFTLREFARLASSLDLEDSLNGPDRWRAGLPYAVRARSMHPMSPQDDDVIDPYRRSDSDYQQMRCELAEALQTIVKL